MRKRVLLLTGSPGVGKTTVVLKVAEILRSKGYVVGGIVSREVRSDGDRIGFEIADLSTGRSACRARINHQWGPQVGRYHVNLGNLNGLAAKAVVDADQSADVVVVDEIGPMELLSSRFREAVIKVVGGRKLVVCTIHWKMGSSLIEDVKEREDAETYVATAENRERLPQIVVAEALNFLQRSDAHKGLKPQCPK